jgi:hypothetical protein
MKSCSSYHVGVGRRHSNGRFCAKKKSGCHTDGALAGAIRRGRAKLSRRRGGCGRR